MSTESLRLALGLAAPGPGPSGRDDEADEISDDGSHGALGFDFSAENGAVEDSRPDSPNRLKAPTHQGHFYHGLKDHGRKQAKFQQKKSLSVRMANQDGVCLPVALMWVQEKLSTTGSVLGISAFSRKRFGKSVLGGTSHVGNIATMLTADVHQSSLVRGDDLSPIENSLSITPDDGYRIELIRRRSSLGVPVVDMGPTLAAAAERLPSGTAMCFEVKVRRLAYEDSEGHAVSIYRSRGGTLHFFDPNIGVYEVDNVLAFMEAWMEGNRKAGWFVSPFFRGTKDADDDSWYHVYSRKK